MTELESFIRKFHQLWSAGHSAHLDVDTYAGGAWVGLRVRLADAPGPPTHFHQYRNRNTPSRQRRRMRRAAAREVHAAEASEEAVAEVAANEEIAVDALRTVEQTGTDKANSVEDSIENDRKAEVVDEPVPVAEQATLADTANCDLCDSVFKTARGLKVHKGRTHKTITQLDGVDEISENIYTFVSSYAEEDVKYTLEEILANDVECELISRVKTEDKRSAEHLCTVRVSVPCNNWQWPKLQGIQAEVVMNLKRRGSQSC